MKKQRDIVSILRNVGAIYTDDHFVYTSGKHGSVYINKDRLYPHTRETSFVGRLFAEKTVSLDMDVVAAPAVGGTILSQWTAYHLSRMKKREILSVYTEKDNGTLASAAEGRQVFRRGYERLIQGKNVLVIEDLTTTGISVRKVVDAVRTLGGNVICVYVISICDWSSDVCSSDLCVYVMVNRNPKEVCSAMFQAPFHSLGVLEAQAFDPSDCPLCKSNVPVNTSIGHGKEYLECMKRHSIADVHLK